MYGYIYKTTNLLNKKIYIGKRKGKFNPLYKGSGKYLIRALNKYGKENFVSELVEYCDTLEEQNSRERYWISYYRSLNTPMYNIANGGDGGDLVTCLPEAEYKRFSQLMSELNRKGIIGNKGKHLSEEHKKNIGKGNKGKVRTDEWKRKHSEAIKGKAPWNKGLTANDPRVAKNVHKVGEFKHTEKSKKLISEHCKGIKKPTVSVKLKGRKWMHNDKIALQVKPEDIEIYKQQGFIDGRGSIK